MYIKSIAVLAAAFSAFALATADSAVADGMPEAAPRAAKPVVAAKVVKRPRYRAGTGYVRGPWPGGPDPYAYSYNRPGYYPYYGSKYWVPRHQMIARTRYPMRIPEYHPSWGYPLACKLHGRAHCGVAYKPRPGRPAHYYNRAQQLRLTGSPRHNY